MRICVFASSLVILPHDGIQVPDQDACVPDGSKMKLLRL